MTMQHVRVGEVLALQRRPVVIEPIEEYRLIGVYSFGKGIFHREPRAGVELGDYRFFRIEPDDLVLSNIQAWEGAIAFATERDRNTVGTHRFLTYQPIKERIDANWARWFFLSEPGMALIRKAAPGTTMRNRTLAIERFESLMIPLPPLDEQRDIAALLDEAVHKATILHDRAVAATSSAALIQQNWLELTMHRFQERRTLSGVATVTRGRGPRYEPGTGVLMINQACIRWGSVALSQAREVEREWSITVPDHARVRADDVLVNSTGEGTIGRVALSDESVAGTPFDSHVLAVRCDTSVLQPAFLAAYLRSRDGQRQVTRAKGANTTKQTELGKRRLEQFQIPVPSLAEQDEIVSHFRGINNVVAELDDRATAREAMIKALVPACLHDAFGSLR